MIADTKNWHPDPLVWGYGDRVLELFLEPTCPFSVRVFSKIDDLLQLAGEDKISIRIWLQSQPWHMFSGIICRAIMAASTGENGKDAAKQVMATIGEHRADFEFDDHRTGPNLNTSPKELIERIEAVSGVPVAEAFQISGLEHELKRHTKYARQNGIHVSPTFMVDGLVNPALSSGDSVEQWLDAITST